MRTVDVIIPTLGHIYKTAHPYLCFSNLKHFPFPIRLHVVTGGKSWAEAINIGLSQTDGKNDVVLMDDDVFIDESTFQGMDRFYEQADIFGFRLLFPDGRVQHAGAYTDGKTIYHIGHGEANENVTKDPSFVCHATTSLIYIKRTAIDVLKGMATDIPGVQFEDVDFNFRAIREGLKILQLPNDAVHMESATKSGMDRFLDKCQLAFDEIRNRYFFDEELMAKLKSYPIKLGATV